MNTSFYFLTVISAFFLQVESMPCLTCLLNCLRDKASRSIVLTTAVPTTIVPSTCKIVLYEDSNQQGENVEITNPGGISNLQMHEEKAKTFGNCCWRIYKYVCCYVLNCLHLTTRQNAVLY